MPRFDIRNLRQKSEGTKGYSYYEESIMDALKRYAKEFEVKEHTIVYAREIDGVGHEEVAYIIKPSFDISVLDTTTT